MAKWLSILLYLIGGFSDFFFKGGCFVCVRQNIHYIKLTI